MPRRRWLGRGLALVFGLLLAAAAAVAGYVYLALPQTSGSTRVDGLQGKLSIERDAHGIPTIRAATAEDAWFGLGFVHAQDRLWQLETHKRIAAGRLAEAFGPGALNSDKFLRALGVRRAAETQWQRASPALRSMLEAYSAGINAFVRQQLRARPPEFLLLGVQPGEWSPVDSIGWSAMMAWDLGGNWSAELLRMRLALTLPVDRINQLLPPYPGDQPLATADYARLYRSIGIADARTAQIAASVAAAPPLPWPLESGVEGVGSNNWVVAGSRSVTGNPLLANDPHLKLSTPGLWYFARIEAPGLEVAGATMPGLPLVVLGQNEHVAWGFTNTAPDVQDLYLERIDTGGSPAARQRYETPEGWGNFEQFAEVIKIKGQADVAFTARRSRHGPIISDAGGATAGLTGDDGSTPRFAIALRWTALDPDATGTLAAGLAFNRARSVDEFIAAAASYVAPMQNIVVADRERIAMVAAGRVPLRRPDNDLKGLAPAPGWDARYDWGGTLAADATPRERDPPRGWIATANQRVHGPDYPHFITSEWAAPYRQQRIEQLLAARPLHSLDSLAAIQGDVLSLATQRLLPFVKRARSEHPLAAAAQRQLEGFEGTMAAERAAPLIFYAWARQLTLAVFGDDVGRELLERQLGNRSFREALEGVLERDDSSWCDDVRTRLIETCAAQADAAFGRALDELQDAHGPDVAQWRWGQAHVARAEHRPFSREPRLARWFELRTPVGGDTYTLNAARVSLRPDATTGELYLDEHGPGLRALYDLGDRSKSRFMHSSGQSGLVFSGNYRGFLERWARVDYLPVWGDGRPQRVLELLPR